MIQVPRWKVFIVLFVCLLGIAYSLPNISGADWMQKHFPSWGPGRTVNLGLDLRGGAHLLYEVDVGVVFEERGDMMISDLRTELRKAKIGYTRLSKIDKGLRVILKDEAVNGEEARKIIRRTDPNLEIVTNGNSVDAVLNNAAQQQIYEQTIDQSIEIVRRRIDELGTTEPIIQRQGDNRILVQAPGANAEELKAVIGTTAKLTFHLVPEPGREDRRGLVTLPMEEDEFQSLTIQEKPELTGDMLDGAQPSFNQGESVISFRFNGVGARKFCNLTRDHVHEPFAIVLDNEVISAPRINEPICGGSGIISGSFTPQSANQLAMLLRSGALPAPMSVVEERTVGPSLGTDSVEAGKIASLFGFVFVLVFMVLAYGTFGFFANVALFLNICLIFAALSMLQATLTLPGIAGIVLTMGMAVDANVLIYERIREEFAGGRSIMASIDSGYRQAMTTIVDSNLTTLIAAAILFSFGTGPIKGFAVTLSIGIITSMFSAIMVTRLMVVWWLSRNKNAKFIPV